MRAPLVVGLGNPLAGDDGVGWHVAERLRRAPELEHCEILQGDDLLRLAPDLEERPVVVLIDAILDDGPPGEVRPLPLQALDPHGHSAHQIPPAQALELLRLTHPSLRSVPILFFGVAVGDVRLEPRLSPRLQGAMDTIIAALTRALRETTSRPQSPLSADQV